MTRKKARRTTVEVREARRVVVVGGGGKENERRRLRRALDRCVGVKMGVWLFCTTRREAKTVLTRIEMLKWTLSDVSKRILIKLLTGSMGKECGLPLFDQRFFP